MLSYHWRLYQRLIAVHIRGQMQYRLSFLFDIITMLFTNLTGFLTLALVLQKFNGIGGWTLGEVAFLYGMVEMAFGTMDMLFSGFDPAHFGAQVRLGRLDQMLLRPVNLTVQVLGSEFVLRRIGRIVEGAAIFVIALQLTQIQWTSGRLLYMPVIFASLVAFFGGLFIIGATLSFWLIEGIEFMNLFTYGGSEMMSYPMHIYQDWMRRFFTFIVPAIFLNYYPALYILNKPDPFHLPPYAAFLAPLAGFGVLAAALLFWNYGIQRYQSTGT